jgi:hypothetical protein
MKKYTVLEEFWHQGVLRAAGSTVLLSAKDAKYRMHILEEVKAEAPAPVAVAAPVEAVAEAVAEDAGVEEVKASKRARKA